VAQKGAGTDWAPIIIRHGTRNWKWFTFQVIITVGSSFLGIFLIGWSGVVAGLIAAIISWRIGARAMKSRDTHHYHPPTH
jgi:hypothetical protein